VAVNAVQIPVGKDKWAPLTALLKDWEFTDNFAVQVGTAEDGEVFLYQAGNMTMHTPVGTASTSKWPSAMMVAGLVNDGTISSLDDLCSKYFDWWTTDEKDPRSKVTVAMLLSFTSGFGGGHPGDEHVNVSRKAPYKVRAMSGEFDIKPSPADCVYTSPNMDIEDCAKAIYTYVNCTGEPGKVYSYNSYHLQLAGAVAAKASGLGI
jgi:CubicO group peptidase (beta-lactamase class C family)